MIVRVCKCVGDSELLQQCCCEGQRLPDRNRNVCGGVGASVRHKERPPRNGNGQN